MMLRGNRKNSGKKNQFVKIILKKAKTLKWKSYTNIFKPYTQTLKMMTHRPKHKIFFFTEHMLDPDLDSDISLEELKRSVFHQKNNALYGLDNVYSEAIKASFDIISPFLLRLVNQIFNSGIYPDSWGQ